MTAIAGQIAFKSDEQSAYPIIVGDGFQFAHPVFVVRKLGNDRRDAEWSACKRSTSHQWVMSDACPTTSQEAILTKNRGKMRVSRRYVGICAGIG